LTASFLAIYPSIAELVSLSKKVEERRIFAVANSGYVNAHVVDLILIDDLIIVRYW
jgi:hypothetical protein